MIEITDHQHSRNVDEYTRQSNIVDGLFERNNSQIEYLIKSGKETMSFMNNYRRANKINKDAMKAKLQAIEDIIASGKEPEPSVFYAFSNIIKVVDDHHRLQNAMLKLTTASGALLSKESERLSQKEYYVIALEEIGKTVPVLEKLVDEFELHFEKVKETNEKIKTDYPQEIIKYWP